MKRTYWQFSILILAAIFTGASAYGTSCPEAEALIRLGIETNSRKLEEIRGQCLVEASRSYKFVIYLASYMAKPGEFASDVAETFPINADEWKEIGKVPESYFTPANNEFFLAQTISDIATEGNEAGIEKLVKVAATAGGGWAEILLQGVIECLMEYPGATLAVVATLNEDERKRMLESAVYLELSDDDVGRFLASIESDKSSHPLLVDEINSITSEMLSFRKQ